MAEDNVGMDVPIKFGFRDIRGADFVSNKRTNIGEAYPNSAKRKAFRLKIESPPMISQKRPIC